MRMRAAYILGNGPSLRGFNFRGRLAGKTCFGMNLAFRFWRQIGWYPAYYSCLDGVVGLNHQDSIAELIENRKKYGIKRFCLRANLAEALHVGEKQDVDVYEELLAAQPFHFRGYWAVTGSLTLAWAIWLGYRRIILLGMDASYQQYVQGARHVDAIVLRLAATPEHNPNYFFDGYQQEGDLYHIPLTLNPAIPYEDQIMGWEMLRPQVELSGSRVINANPGSRIAAFPKTTLARAPAALRKKNGRREAGFKAAPGRASFDIVAFALAVRKPGQLVEVGSYHGDIAARFLAHGWRALAVEADAGNRKELEKRFAGASAIRIDGRAVSCIGGRTYPWYSGSPGWASSMLDIYACGKAAGAIATISLRELLAEYGIKPDLLYLDIPGFEFMALRGAPFGDAAPGCVITSWEDAASLQTGSDMHDTGAFLLSHGYHVYMSEWQRLPDGAPQWLRLCPYPARTLAGRPLGHFIAFRQKPVRKIFARAFALASSASLAPAPDQPAPVLGSGRHRLRF